jgi:hypothetical protein
VIVLNHPGRRAKDVEAVWRAWSFLTKEGAGIVVGAEGAPGHQNAKPLGAYGGALVPEDRWDPSVVAPGAAWDRLLQQGQDVWGALASSDFHAESNGDYWPCQFSYTAIYAPDRSAAGVLRALRAGSFVGVHGGIVRSAELRVMTPGLERAALAGEQVRVPAGHDPLGGPRDGFARDRLVWRRESHRRDRPHRHLERRGAHRGKRRTPGRTDAGTPRSRPPPEALCFGRAAGA